jgi:hypothetical protein
MQARAELGAEYEKPTRKREEEEQLLRDFVATAPACSVPVERKIVDTTTGFAACDFTQSIASRSAPSTVMVTPTGARVLFSKINI